MKDFLVILRRNFVSPIVVAILILATTLLVLGESRDAFFISAVIVFNTLFAIAQEVRAQRALKKLELMSAPHAKRETAEGAFEDVLFDQLLPGNIIQLQAGDETPADGVLVKSNGLEVDESMLTGESLAVEKSSNETVYAGSVIVAGSALVKVIAVGDETRIGKVSSSLKRYTPQLTPLQHAINRAIGTLTYGALVLAALIVVVYGRAGIDAISIFKVITSAAVTIVPEGLLLASSLLLAFGSLKLARAQVLPQKLAAIEAMALLSVLCVDKTGTLTSDEVTFESLELFDKKRGTDWAAIIGIVATSTSGGNATGEAIIKGLPAPDNYEVKDILAFSSARKMSGTRLEYDGKTHTVFIGAPEFMTDLVSLNAGQHERIKLMTSEGKRVLLVVSISDQKTRLKELKSNAGIAVGLIILSNPLRKGVEDTIAYLQKNAVSIRVISGDNPQTVQYVAKEAGIAKSQSMMTGVELGLLDDKEWDKKVLETTIFARVLPEQKERLVETFQRHGQFTGMVGDGVNDALALKKSDLGIAMYAGAAASRRVADVVLLNNSFTSLPLGMKLGNRIMQAIEVISILFFHKIIFGVVLLLTTLVLGLRYPFDPRHVTFMNIFLVTLPTLMWTLAPPKPLHKVNPRRYWRDTLYAVIPFATISGLAVVISYLLVLHIYPHAHEKVTTMVVLVATFFGVYLVFLAPRMLGVASTRQSLYARIGYMLAVAIIGVETFRLGFLRTFFNFAKPSWDYALPLLILVLIAATAQYLLANYAGKQLLRNNAKEL